MIYSSFIYYISCSTSIKDKIARIDSIISLLEDSELANAIDAGTEEYQLDDGQTKVKVSLRDISSIEDTIQKLERRKQRLTQQCTGYRYGLQDGNTKY